MERQWDCEMLLDHGVFAVGHGTSRGVFAATCSRELDHGVLAAGHGFGGCHSCEEEFLRPWYTFTGPGVMSTGIWLPEKRCKCAHGWTDTCALKLRLHHNQAFSERYV